MSRRATPEGAIKQAICQYLAMVRRRGVLDFWLVHSQGMFDATRKRMLRRNSPHDRLGQADITCLIKNGPCLFIEVKYKSPQTEHQKAFQAAVEALGHRYIIAKRISDVTNELNALGILIP